MITAFFLSGPRENPISGFWDRAALVGGMTMVGLGSVTRTLALNARQTHVQAGGDETAYNRYVLNSVLSYSLWALGGTAFILPFVTDLGGGRRDKNASEEGLTERRPENLQLLPIANGVVLRIAY